MRAVEYDVGNNTVTLTWTAVGAVLNIGQGKYYYETPDSPFINYTVDLNLIHTASEYELRYATNGSDIRANFTDAFLVTNEMVINGANLSNPQPSGSKEIFQIMLPRGKICGVFDCLQSLFPFQQMIPTIPLGL